MIKIAVIWGLAVVLVSVLPSRSVDADPPLPGAVRSWLETNNPFVPGCVAHFQDASCFGEKDSIVARDGCRDEVTLLERYACLQNIGGELVSCEQGECCLLVCEQEVDCEEICRQRSPSVPLGGWCVMEDDELCGETTAFCQCYPI
jgi:hypothetical protein